MSGKKSNKKESAEEKIPEQNQFDGFEKVEEYQKSKVNKKLESLKQQQIDTKTNLDKFLTVQGLGQNNRKKVNKYIIKFIQLHDNINFELKQDELKKQKKESEE